MERYMCDINKKETLNVPLLVDLCVETAIENVKYLGDVGETDLKLLERILPHCTVDQLRFIEDSTQGRDLSPLTDYMWKRFYQIRFGEKSYDAVLHKMNSRNVTFKWKELYEAKLKDVKAAQQKSIERIKQQYMNEFAREAA